MWEIEKFFLLNEVLHEKRSGFRENSTTELTVNQIVDEFIKAGKKKLINCAVFLDFAEEFYTINYNISI